LQVPPFEGGKGDDLIFYPIKEVPSKKKEEITLNNFDIKTSMQIFWTSF